MQPIANALFQSQRSIWTGRVLSSLVELFSRRALFSRCALLVMDSLRKFWQPTPGIATCAHLGLPVSAILPLGAICLVCAMLYVVPLTAALGAVLLTGCLGGAVAMHLRVADPLFSHTLFLVYLGLAAWIGLYLRNAPLRALLRAS